MQKFLKTVLMSLFFTQIANAVTVEDQMGKFTLDKTPKRIIALEYSYVDSLAQVGVSPVGVADENDATKLLPQVREKIKPWTSVGMRSQPSLEVIAQLKPDLIIADDHRHRGVLNELKKIAPTVLFNSRETYEESLKTAQKIGDLVGKSKQMKARIQKHKQTIAKYSKNIKKGIKVVFGLSSEVKFNFYNDKSYTGSLLEKMGFIMPKATSSQPYSPASLERVVSEKPDMLIFAAHSKEKNIINEWKKEPLWKLIPAVKNNEIMDVERKIWTLARGMEAAELMASEVSKFVNKK